MYGTNPRYDQRRQYKEWRKMTVQTKGPAHEISVLGIHVHRLTRASAARINKAGM